MDDVVRQAEEIAARVLLARYVAEQEIATKIAESVTAGRVWRCRACDALCASALWPEPACGLCLWCSSAV